MTVPTPGAHGDVTNPNSWQDSTGHIPPTQWSKVPQNTSYPLNGDGRYWFQNNAFSPSGGGAITFVGDPTFFADEIALQWSMVQVAGDGSNATLSYSKDGGVTWTDTVVGPQLQQNGLQSGYIVIALDNTVTKLEVRCTAVAGTSSSTAIMNQIAVAITRNVSEGLQFDYPNPFNPMSYNSNCVDEVVPTDTLSDLRVRVLRRLGFSNQALNPPPGMTELVNDFVISAQTWLYRRYSQLHTKRLFRWKVNPGQRFYSFKDNDEDVLCNYTIDPVRAVEWAGIQDTRNVWYPLIQGIPPQLYTMIDKPWRPARYEFRQAIEVYPAPDQTYWMWFKGHFGLRTFAQDTDKTTIDSELVFLWALSKAKAHYGQPDAASIAADANQYRMELIAGTHQTAHYVPGSIAIPPAVRPTLISFQGSGQGS